MWESHPDTHVGYRRFLTGADDSPELLNITGGSPVVAESPPSEPIAPVAMVQIVPPADPTILEVVTQKIWDQTMNCGEGPSTSAGPLLANFLGSAGTYRIPVEWTRDSGYGKGDELPGGVPAC